MRLLARRRHAAKATTLSTLATGFASAAQRDGFPVNDGFSGVTDFAAESTAADFAAAVAACGPRAMIMCHPGFLDAELLALDPIAARRAAEFKLLSSGGFPATLWHPGRTAMGKPVDWQREWTAAS